jgi:hypothetical protein
MFEKSTYPKCIKKIAAMIGGIKAGDALID